MSFTNKRISWHRKLFLHIGKRIDDWRGFRLNIVINTFFCMKWLDKFLIVSYLRQVVLSLWPFWSLKSSVQILWCYIIRTPLFLQLPDNSFLLNRKKMLGKNCACLWYFRLLTSFPSMFPLKTHIYHKTKRAAYSTNAKARTWNTNTTHNPRSIQLNDSYEKNNAIGLISIYWWSIFTCRFYVVSTARTQKKIERLKI